MRLADGAVEGGASAREPMVDVLEQARVGEAADAERSVADLEPVRIERLVSPSVGGHARMLARRAHAVGAICARARARCRADEPSFGWRTASNARSRARAQCSATSASATAIASMAP